MKHNRPYRPKLPPWIRVKVQHGSSRDKVHSILEELNLNTVCRSANCPNLGECWHKSTATFMIMGNNCTRNCSFCAVPHSLKVLPLEQEEPARIALASKKLGLKYVVVTSVTRDDLPDGGASHFASVIKQLHRELPEAGVEVLTPDFNANIDSLETVMNATPSVFNHNIETVERLSEKIRSVASYKRSLQLLANASAMSDGKIEIKSGLMVGMGESNAEVEQAIGNIRDAGVTILTIGQYLPPSKNHWQLDRYVHPDKFSEWKTLAESMGFSAVASAPLVRSSYNAAEFATTRALESCNDY